MWFLILLYYKNIFYVQNLDEVRMSPCFVILADKCNSYHQSRIAQCHTEPHPAEMFIRACTCTRSRSNCARTGYFGNVSEVVSELHTDRESLEPRFTCPVCVFFYFFSFKAIGYRIEKMPEVSQEQA